MGFVRLILALCVVGSHSGRGLWIGGREAVLAFYIISGFLIAMVLHGPYRDRRLAFYANRALRIFGPAIPTFLIVALIYSLIGIFTARSTFDWVNAFSWVTGIAIVGQDFSWLFAVSPDGLPVWHPFGAGPADGLFNYQLNPPLFTLAIELYFYAIAPWVVSNPWRAMIFAGAGTAYHLFLHFSHLASLGLSYHFFPASWFYFGAGALAFYCSISSGRLLSALYGALIAMSGAALLFETVPLRLVFPVLVFGLPAMARISSAVAIDKIAGDFSYLTYLVHYPFIIILMQKFKLAGNPLFFSSAALSLIAAAILHLALERRIDRIRSSIRQTKRGLARAPLEGAELEHQRL